MNDFIKEYGSKQCYIYEMEDDLISVSFDGNTICDLLKDSNIKPKDLAGVTITYKDNIIYSINNKGSELTKDQIDRWIMAGCVNATTPASTRCKTVKKAYDTIAKNDISRNDIIIEVIGVSPAKRFVAVERVNMLAYELIINGIDKDKAVKLSKIHR
jgi:hypothetical protein